MIGFHWQENEYSYLSNWYKSDFEYGRQTYCCVEQYMMFQKAAMFKMWEVAEEIMKTDDPAVMQKLGQTRSELFDAKIWDETGYEVVKFGLLHKFEQNKELREKLLSTGNIIRLMYEVPYLKLGALISLICMGLGALSLLFSRMNIL